MPSVGEIWIDNDFYGDGTKKKFFVIAAIAQGYITVRRTTSKAHGRATDPACFVGAPHSAFFLDQPAPFWLPTWLCLELVDDVDDADFARDVRTGKYALQGAIPKPLLCQALRCMVSAGQKDVTNRQRRVIADAIAVLGCP